MKLERKWARMCLVLLLMAILSLGELALVHGNLFVTVAILIQFVLFFIAAGVVRHIGLRCAHCGKYDCPPRWNPGRRFYCPNCGEPFIFADEEDER